MEGSGVALLGRAREEGALAAAIDADRATIVAGEAGIGKTTLIRTVASGAGRRVLEGGGFATLDWLPYLALRRALGVGLAGDAASVAAQVEQVVGPDILFVDDLQWVDQDSLAAIELLFGRILVLGSLRTGDPGADRVADLLARTGVESLSLEGLDDDAAAEVVRRARPGVSPGATERIVRGAGGNPLLLEELALSGEASTVLGRALSSRVALLSEEGRATAELLAVAAEPVPSALAGPGAAEVVRAEIGRASNDMVEIRHALVGEAIRGALGDERRRAIHRALADAAPGALARARHLAAAGEAAKAATTALMGLDGENDPRDRAALLVIAADASEGHAGLEMRIRAARALDEVGDWAGVLRTLDPADGEGTPGELAERDSLLAHAAYALGDLPACRSHLEAANGREVEPGSAAAVRRAIETATYLVNVEGKVTEAVATLDGAAVSLDAASGDASAIRVLRECILLLATGAGDPAIVRAGLESAFGAAEYRTATDRARVLQYLHLMRSSAEAALEFLLLQRARFAEARVGGVAIEFHADAVVAAVLAGRLELAATLADELLEEPAPPRARQMAAIHGAKALYLLGRFDQAAEQLTGLAPDTSPDYFGRGELLAAEAELAFWSGRPRAAAELADAALAVPPPVPFAHVVTQVIRAWARLEQGADPGAPPSVALTPGLAGAVAEIEGLRAWRADDAPTAAAAFARAATDWGGFHVPGALRCRWAAAESRRRAGESRAAIEELSGVLQEASGIGFEPLAARVRRSLRLAGVRSPTGARPQGAAAGGLTTRERELVGLVERGLTNVEIARRLGLGRPTVARIVASAMTKLGVGSRAQLAAAAPRAGAGVRPGLRSSPSAPPGSSRPTM